MVTNRQSPARRIIKWERNPGGLSARALFHRINSLRRHSSKITIYGWVLTGDDHGRMMPSGVP